MPQRHRSHVHHTALKELRLSLHMTLNDMASALQPHLPSGIAPSTAAIQHWETEPAPSHKRSSLPSSLIFAGTDAITAYGEVFRERGMGDWFDHHAPHFRQLFAEALATRHNRLDLWNPKRLTTNER